MVQNRASDPQIQEALECVLLMIEERLFSSPESFLSADESPLVEAGLEIPRESRLCSLCRRLRVSPSITELGVNTDGYCVVCGAPAG